MVRVEQVVLELLRNDRTGCIRKFPGKDGLGESGECGMTFSTGKCFPDFT
jgi:hypothetical protein